MIIQHNIPALNAHRNLGINNSATAKNLEKLSSGYRINRAGDDAAGLAISEKMRGQIRGLAMAEQNTSNGISLIQTAEGGLNETHAILQRMRELAVQSSNGTYQEEDRAQIALEVDALKSEIDRIATSTHYNGIKLLDGTLGGVGQTAGNTFIFTGLAGVSAVVTTGVTFADDMEGTITVSKTNQTATSYIVSLQAGDQTWTSLDNLAAATATYTLWLNGITSGADAKSITLTNAAVAATGVVSGIKMSNVTNAAAALSFTKNTIVARSTDELVFQIGANGGADQRVGLHVNNMSTGALGTMINQTVGTGANAVTYNINGTVAGLSVKTREAANKAIEVIDAATNQVSSQRASLGALQNRLEHTLNNLGVTKENLTAAESTIRDVDMAKEMMEFTKNNILVQSAQAMLAQANALPQGVLSLLR